MSDNLNINERLYTFLDMVVRSGKRDINNTNNIDDDVIRYSRDNGLLDYQQYSFVIIGLSEKGISKYTKLSRDITINDILDE